MNSDALNPMVIKELRQGLKSKSFLATFLGLQATMVLSMFIYLSTASANNGRGSMEFADGFFWFMLGLMLLVFMPLRAFGALNEEIKGNTLEMLFLTRMDAWKITLGKWCALVVQVFLLVSAVLPYLVLRYFLGTIDVAGNLKLLFYQVVISMLFVSVGVGLSAWTSKLLRGLVILGSLMSLYMVPILLFSFSMGGGMGGGIRLFGWVEFLVGLVVVGVLMMFFVEYGASQIAPPAENHSLRKRLLALLLAGVLGVYAVFYKHSSEAIMVSMLMLIPVAIDALCEPLVGIKSVYAKLRKFRMARWLFYPGWASGFLFVSLLFFVQILLVAGLEVDNEVLTFGLVAYNTLIFPFVCIRLISVLKQKPLISYISLQAAGFAFCLMMIFLEEIHFVKDFIILGHLMPMLGFFVMAVEDISDLKISLLLFPMAAMLTIILMKSRKPLMQMQYLSKDGEG